MTIDDDTGAHWRPALAGAFLLHTDPSTPPGPPLEDVPPDAAFAFRLLDPSSPVSLAKVAPFWADAWRDGSVSWMVQSGQYDMTPDHRPCSARPRVAGLWTNCGYSGHGIMAGPAGSRHLVDLITGGETTATRSVSIGTCCLGRPTSSNSRSCYITTSRYTVRVGDPFSALADPTRRRLLELLASGDRPAGSLVAAFPALSQPAVSRHLRVLRQAGLVRYRREAQRRIYSMDRGGLARGREVARSHGADWDNRLDRLAAEISEQSRGGPMSEYGTIIERDPQHATDAVRAERGRRHRRDLAMAHRARPTRAVAGADQDRPAGRRNRRAPFRRDR